MVFPDILVTGRAEPSFRNTGKGTFVDVTAASGLGGRESFSTVRPGSTFDRDGFLDLFVCNYVKWFQNTMCFCSPDGQRKSYCTPEAYRVRDMLVIPANRGAELLKMSRDKRKPDRARNRWAWRCSTTDRDAGRFCSSPMTRTKQALSESSHGISRRWPIEPVWPSAPTGRPAPALGIDVADFENSGAPGAITNFDSEGIDCTGKRARTL